MTTKDEALKSLHEASLSIDCLCADWTEHFVDENNIGLPESLQDINNQKSVLKDVEGLQQDLDHIQNQITILENFLDPDSTYNPYAPKRTLNEN